MPDSPRVLEIGILKPGRLHGLPKAPESIRDTEGRESKPHLTPNPVMVLVPTNDVFNSTLDGLAQTHPLPSLTLYVGPRVKTLCKPCHSSS